MNNQMIAATVLCIAIGSWLLVSAAWMILHAWRSRTWPSVWGVVVSAGADEGPGAIEQRRLVSYQYRVGEREHTGRRIFFGDAFWGWSKSATVRPAASGYEPGEEIRIFFDPDSPERCVLHRGVDERLYFLVALGVLFLIAGVGALSGLARVE